MTAADLFERDNCPCPACLHLTSHERLVMVIDEGDGPHAPSRAPRDSDPALTLAHTLAHMTFPAVSVPIVQHRDLHSAHGLERFLVSLLTAGVVVVTDTPNIDGEVVRLAEIIGYARPTNFGTIFDVVSKPAPNSNAYTAFGLELHSDLPYYTSPPDFQFLHVLVNDATGGESLIVDAIRTAEHLRAHDPQAYQLLATWQVPFRFLDNRDDIRGTWPVIECNGDQTVGVRFNNGVRDVDWHSQGPDGARFYSAYLSYWQMLRERAFTLRLEAGQVLCFDNRRMLHGRLAFDADSGLRHLQGCYVDRDMVLSRYRMLHQA